MIRILSVLCAVAAVTLAGRGKMEKLIGQVVQNIPSCAGPLEEVQTCMEGSPLMAQLQARRQQMKMAIAEQCSMCPPRPQGRRPAGGRPELPADCELCICQMKKAMRNVNGGNQQNGQQMDKKQQIMALVQSCITSQEAQNCHDEVMALKQQASAEDSPEGPDSSEEDC